MARIHPSAVIAAGAEIADDVEIGPFCVVGAAVTIAAGVRLHAHVVVEGTTRVGERTEIYPFAAVGTAPQDLKYKGEPSRLEIGCDNRIREHVTINPGTEGGGMVTRIGDNNLLMVGSHVGHDCQIGNHCILVNNGTLAGHVVLEDHAIVGGLSAVHQFVRIGKHVMIGGMTGVEQDVVPFATVTGNRAALQGLNLLGLKRRGFDRETLRGLRAAYKLLFHSAGTFADRVVQAAELYGKNAAVMDMVRFLQTDSQRGFCMPEGGDGGA